ncbi:MAG: leucine-rich repeat domain-containing protein [Treponema sp.]|nr:leucine-rich repeat domain-containing protein [Treponema sp.]
MKLKKLLLLALVLVTLHVSAKEYLKYDENGEITSIVGYDKKTIPKNLVLDFGIGIDDSAFAGCKTLESVTCPCDHEFYIGTKAFQGCTSLKKVYIPSNVNWIGDGAFQGCTSLKEINFGGTKEQWTFVLAGFNAVGNNVTVRCSNGNAEPIDKNARKIVIPSGVTEIANSPFKYCYSLESITIPDSITKFGYNAFEGCNSLKNITFEGSKAQWTFGLAGFNAVGTNVTVHCSDGKAEPIDKNARKISIPSGITKINSDVFKDCTSLKEITFGGTKGQWTFELAGFAAVKDNVTVHCSDGDAERIDKNTREIIIPEGITKIAKDTFHYYDYSLESITIPSSVNDISGFVLDDVYTHSPEYKSICNRAPLKEIIFGGTKAQWTFELAGAQEVWVATATGACNVLCPFVPYLGPNNSIDVYCSDGKATPIDRNTSKIVIPEGITKIGEGVFYDCGSLENVTIPDSVTEIGNWAFQDCNSLKTITFTGSREKLEEIKIGKGNKNFLRANLSCAYETEAERLAEVERKERLMPAIIAKLSSGEKNIKLKGSYSDEDLKSLNDAIAKANQKIDLDLSNAQKMPSLEWLTNFYNIEKVRLPKGLGKITVNLEEAKKIVPHPESKNIFAKDGLLYTNMGKTVYAVVEDAKSYTIPEGTKEIKASVFKDSGLESISLPKSLANIWEYAFEGCTNLKTVNYAGSKKAWKNIYINDDGKGNKLLHKAKFVYGEK